MTFKKKLLVVFCSINYTIIVFVGFMVMSLSRKETFSSRVNGDKSLKIKSNIGVFYSSCLFGVIIFIYE